MPDLTSQELEGLRSLLNDIAPSLSLALAEQISHEVTLEAPTIENIALAELMADEESVHYTVFMLNQPPQSESVFLFTEETTRILVDLMEGHPGTEPPEFLSEDQTKLFAKGMAGVARGIATALGNRMSEAIEVEACATNAGTITLPPIFALEGNAVQAKLQVNIPDVTDTEVTFFFTPDCVRELLANAPVQASSSSSDGVLSEDELAAMLNDIGMGGDLLSGGMGGDSGGMGSSSMPAAPFPNFPSAPAEAPMPRGIDLILDIPLDVTVELGRVRMLIKDVLELSSGSIVELDRVAGEPVDLLVNGRLIAKGEVVVIEDNFGIRITEIISPADRLTGLGKGR